MQWSRLRASVRSFICPELRTRIDFHVTRYMDRGKAKSGMITVDGKKLLTFSYDRFCREGVGWFAALPPVVSGPGYSIRSGPGYKEWEWSPQQTDEIHPPQQLGDAMRAYLDMPVRTAIKSPNPFIRSLAIVDRRIGKTTLKQLAIRENDHSLVKEFYRLRMESLKREETGATIR